MTKYRFYLLTLILGLVCVSAYADDDDADNTVGVRFSAEVDKKLAKGLHVFVGEELRLQDTFNEMDTWRTNIGVSYKFNRYFKTALTYTAIDKYSVSDQAWDWRHRLAFDLIGMYKVGDFKFSLRERLQGTYKVADVNEYQRPQTKLDLRSRLKVSYDIPHSHLNPYAAIEARLFLNGAKWSSESMTSNYASATYSGHNDMYINRFRTEGGLEWKITKQHALDFYCLYDYLTDLNIDSKKSSAVLKCQITTSHPTYFGVGVGYKFTF